MKKTQRVWVALAFLCAGCSGTLPDQMKIQGPLPDNTRSIAIRPMPMKPGTVKNVEDVEDAPLFFAQSLKNALARKQPTWRVELWEGQIRPPETDLVANAEVVDIEGGSRAARFWIGLGVGAAHSTVQVSILNRAGKELANARISEATVCPVGLCVAANKAVIQQDLETLAGKAADFIINPPEFEKKKEGR